MEKEKQIEEMIKTMSVYIPTPDDEIRAKLLYAAGYGNVKEAVKEAEHRAEVAERAVKLCETAYILALNGKQHESISQQAIVSDLGVHKFFIEQAEKELSEEQI